MTARRNAARRKHARKPAGKTVPPRNRLVRGKGKPARKASHKIAPRLVVGLGLAVLDDETSALVRDHASRSKTSLTETLRALVAQAVGLAAPGAGPRRLIKPDADSPCLLVTGRETLSVKAGTIFGGVAFDRDTPVYSSAPLEAGRDYIVAMSHGSPTVAALEGPPAKDGHHIGGFHSAPGASRPAINPCSVWDINFRPACPDPRGMALVQRPDGKKFWADIYLLGRNHLTDGTSKCGVTIADGNDPPQNPAGGYFPKLDYATAVTVMRHHGKGLLAPEDFYAAASGVTENSSANSDPRVTGLDAARSSKFGLMQATGNMWVWGHDGDPDTPRASFFGGAWWDGGGAGSRYAGVACDWPGNSSGGVGARGRGDHLQLV